MTPAMQVRISGMSDRQLAAVVRGGGFAASAAQAQLDTRAGRSAVLAVCTWVVQVFTASLYPADAEWYPDSPSDVYTDVECGASVRSLDGTTDHVCCDNGHTHHAYGTEEAERDIIEMEDRYRQGGY